LIPDKEYRLSTGMFTSDILRFMEARGKKIWILPWFGKEYVFMNTDPENPVQVVLDERQIQNSLYIQEQEE